MELSTKQVMVLIDKRGPSLGCGDYTYPPVFPNNRRDVCAVRRMAENGFSYGFDTIYLVWVDSEGTIQHREIVNSRDTKDYIDIRSISADGDTITIKYGSGGSYSGTPWETSDQNRIS